MVFTLLYKYYLLTTRLVGSQEPMLLTTEQDSSSFREERQGCVHTPVADIHGDSDKHLYGLHNGRVHNPTAVAWDLLSRVKDSLQLKLLELREIQGIVRSEENTSMDGPSTPDIVTTRSYSSPAPLFSSSGGRSASLDGTSHAKDGKTPGQVGPLSVPSGPVSPVILHCLTSLVRSPPASTVASDAVTALHRGLARQDCNLERQAVYKCGPSSDCGEYYRTLVSLRRQCSLACQAVQSSSQSQGSQESQIKALQSQLVHLKQNEDHVTARYNELQGQYKKLLERVQVLNDNSSAREESRLQVSDHRDSNSVALHRAPSGQEAFEMINSLRSELVGVPDPEREEQQIRTLALISTLKRQLEETEAEWTDRECHLLNALQEQHQELVALRCKVTSLNSIKAYNEQLQSELLSVQEVLPQKKAMEAALEKLQTEVDSLHAQLTSTHEDGSAMRQALLTVDQETSAMLTEVEMLLGAVHGATTTRTSVALELVDLLTPCKSWLNTFHDSMKTLQDEREHMMAESEVQLEIVTQQLAEKCRELSFSEDKIEQLSRQVVERDAQVVLMSSHVQELSNAVQVKESCLEAALCRIEELLRTVEDREGQSVEAEQQVGLLHGQLAVKDRELCQLKGRLADLEQVVAGKDVELASAARVCEDLHSIKEEETRLVAELGQLNAQITACEEESRELRVIIVEKELAINSKDEELATVGSKVCELEELVEEKEQQLALVKQNMKELKMVLQEKDELAAAMAMASETMSTQNARLDYLQQQLTGQTQRSTSLEVQLVEERQRVVSLEESLSAVQADSQTLKSDLLIEQQKVQAGLEVIGRQQEVLDEMAQEVSQHQSTEKELLQDVGILQQHLCVAQEEAAIALANVAEQVAACTAMEEQLSGSEVDRAALLQEVISQQTEITSLRETEQLLLKDVDEVAEKVEVYRSTMQDAVSDRDELVLQTHELTAVVDFLQNELSEACLTRNDLQETLTAAVDQLARSEVEMRQKGEEQQHLYETIARMEAQFAVLVPKLKETEMQVLEAKVAQDEAEEKLVYLESRKDRLVEKAAKRKLKAREALALCRSLSAELGEVNSTLHLKDVEVVDLRGELQDVKLHMANVVDEKEVMTAELADLREHVKNMVGEMQHTLAEVMYLRSQLKAKEDLPATSSPLVCEHKPCKCEVHDQGQGQEQLKCVRGQLEEMHARLAGREEQLQVTRRDLAGHREITQKLIQQLADQQALHREVVEGMEHEVHKVREENQKLKDEIYILVGHKHMSRASSLDGSGTPGRHHWSPRSSIDSYQPLTGQHLQEIRSKLRPVSVNRAKSPFSHASHVYAVPADAIAEIEHTVSTCSQSCTPLSVPGPPDGEDWVIHPSSSVDLTPREFFELASAPEPTFHAKPPPVQSKKSTTAFGKFLKRFSTFDHRVKPDIPPLLEESRESSHAMNDPADRGKNRKNLGHLLNACGGGGQGM